ncbi:MAG: Trm112 family protein [Candidatus Omnitrophica bacterium]|nr:Trm112 family protein [Candidatus Omnitrophota bacterium]
MIDEALLKILACPACKADVKMDNDKITCVKCKRRYPVKDGIPVMLINESDKEN